MATTNIPNLLLTLAVTISYTAVMTIVILILTRRKKKNVNNS